MTVSKTKTTLIASGIGIAALVAGAGVGLAKSGPGNWGHHGGQHFERMIEAMDGNQDGALTPEEVAAYRDARFTAMDTDKDGELTPRELSDGFRAMRFASMDADGDGMVSEAEFMESGKGRHWGGKRFHRMDENGNGRLDPAEMAAVTEHMISRLDRNDDGIIGSDELQEMRDRHHR